MRLPAALDRDPFPSRLKNANTNRSVARGERRLISPLRISFCLTDLPTDHSAVRNSCLRGEGVGAWILVDRERIVQPEAARNAFE